MAHLHILGSAAAVSDATHDNTHFLLIGESGAVVLVDCGSNPLNKIRALGLNPDAVGDVVLTHFHPDHVSGFSNYLMQMWLLGRKAPLRVYGLAHCMDAVAATMAASGWETWPRFPQTTLARVEEGCDAAVFENADFRVTAFPARHFVPTMGLRIVNKRNGRVLAYSADTEPTPDILELARGADMLLHEAAGKGLGHSSARQAGEVATAAGAKSLYLIHYQVWNADPARLSDEAQQAYAGDVTVCEDGDTFEF